VARQDQLTLDSSFLLQEIEREGYELDIIDGDTYIIRHAEGVVFGPDKNEVIEAAHAVIFGFD
jgi:hypothetical protein